MPPQSNEVVLPYLSELLPLEIREMIWKESLPGPNIVTISMRRVIHQGAARYDFDVSYKIPTALHICTSSRMVAKKVYELAYSRNIGTDGFYFDFKKDALLFHGFDRTDTMMNAFFRIGGKENHFTDNRLRHLLIRGTRYEYNLHIRQLPPNQKWYHSIGEPETIFSAWFDGNPESCPE